MRGLAEALRRGLICLAPTRRLRVAGWWGGLTSDDSTDFVDLSFDALPWRVAREVRARSGEKGP